MFINGTLSISRLELMKGGYDLSPYGKFSVQLRYLWKHLPAELQEFYEEQAGATGANKRRKKSQTNDLTKYFHSCTANSSIGSASHVLSADAQRELMEDE